MRRQHPRIPGRFATALALGLLAIGCGEAGPPPAPVGSGRQAGGAAAGAAGSAAGDRDLGIAGAAKAAMDPAMREALLRNVVNLLERAPLTPGGDNINIATTNLNQYFEDADATAFRLDNATRAFLAEQLSAIAARLKPSAEASGRPLNTAFFDPSDFEGRQFELKDARHIEDCLLYHNVASRIAGGGTIRERVDRLFDWTVRHVQLVPVGAPIPQELADRGFQHAPSRPYDILMRGLASEVPGDLWAERSWVFAALCRQIGVDVAVLGYPVEGREEPYYYWACAALVDGTPYLYDAAIGLAIPGPDGHGVATLEEAATDPSVLDRLDLPAPALPYETDHADLSKVRVFIESSRGYVSPKMRELEDDLYGDLRMILYRDPLEQRDAWAAALGDRFDGVAFWPLPISTEYRLFNDPSYVQPTQFVNLFFDPTFPILGGRLRELKGDLADAKQDFTRFRFREAIPVGKEMVRLPDEIRQGLDLLSTYYLALCQLEDDRPSQAADLFRQYLRLPPGEPLRGQLATLAVFGADANLGLIYEALGDPGRATYYYSRSNPTSQSIGNLRRANALVFADPFGPAPPPPGAAGPDESSAEGDAPAAP